MGNIAVESGNRRDQLNFDRNKSRTLGSARRINKILKITNEVLTKITRFDTIKPVGINHPPK